MTTVDRRPRAKSGKAKTTRMNGKDKRRKTARLLLRDGNRCWWCAAVFTKTLPSTLDHLLPLKDGGSDRLSNLCLACAPCNNGRANPPLGRRRCTSDTAVIPQRSGATVR